MKMYIPTIGEEIKLSEDWTFELYYEKRNNIGMLKELFGEDAKKYHSNYDPRYTEVIIDKRGFPCNKPRHLSYTLKKGTILIVDRIYIRRGSPEYDSITFKTKGNPVKRFWVKLADTNKIEFKQELKPVL